MNKRVKLIGILLIVTGIFASFSFDYKSEVPVKKKKIKYIFLFIGDGMGIAQMSAANEYLKLQKEEELCFTKFPSFSLTTTHCKDSFKITDSAAAGTAIACGKKTSLKVVGMDKQTNEKFVSVADIAKQNGMKVGIISSVELNHATPASFYGHQDSRYKYSELAKDMWECNFDYFAGGGLIINGSDNEGNGHSAETLQKNYSDIIDSLTKASFNIISDRNNFSKIKKYKGQKIILSQFIKKGPLPNGQSIPYKIDNVKNFTSLAEYTKLGIDFLNNPKGFLIMTEGGKIDWACHGHDAASAIHDVIAFNDAIKEALEFYKKHPEETLIIVTADHETGGMGLGYKKTNYEFHLDFLQDQKISGGSFKDTLAEYSKEKYPELIEKYFGIKEFVIWPSDDDYSVVKNLISHINNKAGIGWTSGSHSACPVGTYVLGDNSDLFNCMIDNTDIMKNIIKLAELKTE